MYVCMCVCVCVCACVRVFENVCVHVYVDMHGHGHDGQWSLWKRRNSRALRFGPGAGGFIIDSALLEQHLTLPCQLSGL